MRKARAAIVIAAITYIASQHIPSAPSREEDEAPDMSAICIVDTPVNSSGEMLTAEQLAIVYASDGVRDKNGELVLSPLLERDKNGEIVQSPGVQGPWRRGDLTAQLPWYAPWMMIPRIGDGSCSSKDPGRKGVPEPSSLALMSIGFITLIWRNRNVRTNPVKKT